MNEVLKNQAILNITSEQVVGKLVLPEVATKRTGNMLARLLREKFPDPVEVGSDDFMNLVRAQGPRRKQALINAIMEVKMDGMDVADQVRESVRSMDVKKEIAEMEALFGEEKKANSVSLTIKMAKAGIILDPINQLN